MVHEMENAETKMDTTLKKMAKVLRLSNGDYLKLLYTYVFVHFELFCLANLLLGVL